MNELVRSSALRPCTSEQIAAINDFIERHKDDPQVELRTEHHLHAGVYSRTIYVPAGVVVAGVLVKVPTQLIIAGHCILTDGGEDRELNGYHVLDGAAYRQAATLAIEPTAYTMLFATDAETVEEAENEFTNEADRLLTRREKLICREQQ